MRFEFRLFFNLSCEWHSCILSMRVQYIHMIEPFPTDSCMCDVNHQRCHHHWLVCPAGDTCIWQTVGTPLSTQTNTPRQRVQKRPSPAQTSSSRTKRTKLTTPLKRAEAATRSPRQIRESRTTPVSSPLVPAVSSRESTPQRRTKQAVQQQSPGKFAWLVTLQLVLCPCWSSNLFMF